MAAEIILSVPTVMSIERGEASASMAVYAAALQYYGRLEWLPDLMAPEFDREALRIEFAGIRSRPARR